MVYISSYHGKKKPVPTPPFQIIHRATVTKTEAQPEKKSTVKILQESEKILSMNERKLSRPRNAVKPSDKYSAITKRHLLGGKRSPYFFVGLAIIITLLASLYYRSSRRFQLLLKRQDMPYKQVLLTTTYVNDVNKLQDNHLLKDAVILPKKGNLFFNFLTRSKGYLYGVHITTDDIKQYFSSSFLRQHRYFRFTTKNLDVFYPPGIDVDNFKALDEKGRLETIESIVTYRLFNLKKGHHLLRTIKKEKIVMIIGDEYEFKEQIK